jgi:uncharacterized protein DUF4245
MMLSLTVLIVPIALLLIFYRVVLSGDAPVTVDPTAAIQEARQTARFPVAVPHPGEDWHTTSARFVREQAGMTLRIGYVDPDQDPVLLVQSSVPPATLLRAELTEAAEPLDAFRTELGVWRLYKARPGEKALVLTEPARTVIVIGKAGTASLEELVTSLS